LLVVDKPMKTRLEKDTLGNVEVPADAYYGAQTARAVANFPISGLKPHPALVWGTVVIKKCAARANMATGRLPGEIGDAIVRAADEVLAGMHADQFVVDPFQAGAGTSHNMNVNEVLANRAEELLGGKCGVYARVHPNDHVNMAQSTNDVIPTAMRLAALRLIHLLNPELEALGAALHKKGSEFDHILKSGRTHLQDAVPLRLGQEFEAYAVAIDRNRAGIERSLAGLHELGIGGTAVGTGINAEERYIDLVVAEIGTETGFPVFRSANLIETTQNMDPFVAVSSALKGVAVNLIRIANDLRLLSSGPRTGLAEIALPPLQPGSSIMPGKVNPVMAELTDMVAFQVIGADAAITLAAQAGQLELNVMMPVIAFNLLFALEILKNTARQFGSACIAGITADGAHCMKYMEDSVGLVTVLAPYIGYAAAAEVAKESMKTGRSIRDIIVAREILTPEALAQILDPLPLTNPGVPGKRK
jgi:aspartate ammonia-lyase